MKKIYALFLASCLAITLAGCGQPADTGSKESTSSETNTQSNVVESTQSTEAENNASVTESEESEVAAGGTAVVYFSATGNTAGIAKTMAQLLDAPLYEIIPEEPYSKEDLNYNDDSCRANKEMNDDSARPAISGNLDAVETCDTIYLGHPIWWGNAPRIINTFLESYDLSGKTVYTFCTSGSSGIETSVSDLQELYPEINIVSGHRFSNGASENAISDWLQGLEKEK
ncbi:flavodoxin [Lacrimispora brassicae]